jgi:hypothetical protein
MHGLPPELLLGLPALYEAPCTLPSPAEADRTAVAAGRISQIRAAMQETRQFP